METEHRKNLLILAAYLESLPEDYKHFDMGDFRSEGCGLLGPGDTDPNVCPSCACAIGHGPNAGLEIHSRDYNWFDYARRLFGTDGEDELWDKCFSINLSNNAHEAAARIRSYVDENQ